MLLSFVIIKASSDGWGSPRTLGEGGAALLLIACFGWLEGRVRNPMVPLRIFRSRNITGATAVRMLLPFAGMGTPFLGALYLQHILKYSPIGTGLAFLPMFFIAGICPLLVTPWIMSRVGAKATLVPGLVLMAVGVVLFGSLPVHGQYVANVLPAMLVAGLGAGLVFTPSIALAMTDVAPADTGLASGLAIASVQLGGGLGVAVLASISTSRSNELLARGTSRSAALVGGYHVGFLTAAGCLTAAAIVGALILRDRSVGRAQPSDRAAAAISE
jgi:fucose permease